MGGETYKINESGRGATTSLLFRFFRLYLVLGIVSFPLFFVKLGMDKYPIALLAILGLCLLVFITKREAEFLHFENGKITVKGKRFFFVPFKTKVELSRVKYRFNKPNDKKKPVLLRKTPKLVLYKDSVKWAEFTGSAMGWGKSRLAEMVKALISKGCYNWFEFNKKSRRKKKSS